MGFRYHNGRGSMRDRLRSSSVRGFGRIVGSGTVCHTSCWNLRLFHSYPFFRWFFGPVARREAENYLRDVPPGTFLIRSRDEETSRKINTKRASKRIFLVCDSVSEDSVVFSVAQYTISLKKDNGSIRHYQIWRLAPRYGDGYFVTKRKKFPSVTDLVEWYRRK